MREPVIGEPMVNTAVPLMFRKLEEPAPNLSLGIVLAYVQNRHEFATWLYIDPPDDDEEPYCVAGNYHDDVEAAIADYIVRK